MIISPIIPLWLMIPITILFVIVIVLNKGNIKNLIIRLMIVALLFMINLRIMTSSSDIQILSSNVDVLFVIDNTISMVAEDYDGKNPRLDAVKDDCNYIIDELAGARFAVVTFNDTSQILAPFTTDATMAAQAIETITVADSFYARGTTLNVALEDMENVLESSEKKGDRTRVVFFISDGEITSEDSKLKSFSSVKEYVSNGAVLGYGTTKGGNMKVKDRYDDTEEYLEDQTTHSYPYPKAVSKIDEDNLKQIADDIGVDYINMSKQSEIDSKLKEIKKQVNGEVPEETKKESFSDTYYYFVIPLLILLTIEFIIYKRKL